MGTVGGAIVIFSLNIEVFFSRYVSLLQYFINPVDLSVLCFTFIY